jgi:central kinetochore subunit Mis15/CHL4
MDLLSIPTTSALPSTQSIPASHPIVQKTLSRLSRSSLISLVLDWLDDRNRENVAPYLAHPDDEPDEQEIYPPARSLAELRELYQDLQAGKGSKRDVVERVTEGDFRDGLTLYQLAMADMQYLYDHPLSQKWTALKVVRLQEDEEAASKPAAIPRFHPSTFLRNLQREVLPDVKAHFNLDRHGTLPLTILRIFILESPYATSTALSKPHQQITESSRTFYIAFPDASPFVFISLLPPTPMSGHASRGGNKSLRKLMLDGIPKAFSKPRERYKLESTNLSARSLAALVERRGPNGTNAAGGGWSIYAEEKKDGLDNPLNVHLPTPERSVEGADETEKKNQEAIGLKRARDEDSRVVKRRKQVAQVRFGHTGKADDGKGIERLDIRMEDPFPGVTELPDNAEEADASTSELRRKRTGRQSNIQFEDATGDDVSSDGWTPDVRFTFHGTHVHAGIRELVEAGIMDGEKMPGWMTGEEGVSVGAVRRGRIRGYKGSGV